jgi:hypothetical protein
MLEATQPTVEIKDLVQDLPKEPEAPAKGSVTTRNEKGQFLKGAAPGPGRPPKLEVGDIQLTIERAVRKHFPAKRIIDVVERTFDEAMSSGKGAIACRKLIFEYFIQKPKMVEESDSTGQSITIKIENATFKAQHEPGNIIDVEATEVISND